MNIKRHWHENLGWNWIMKMIFSANILLFQCFSNHVSGGSVANTEERFFCFKGIQEEVSSNPSGLLYDDGCLSTFDNFYSSFTEIIIK